MADIVVLDTTKPTDVKQRQSGMKLLGEVFNGFFQNAALTDEEIVNKTIQDIIKNHPGFVVTYLKETNILSIKNENKGTYYYDPNDPKAVLKLRATRDKKEQHDGENVDVMYVAVSGGNGNLLAPNNYLSKVLTDLRPVGTPANDPIDSAKNRKYLLGTITFRRCR